MSDTNFNFNEFISDSLLSLQDPKRYFSGLKTSGGFGEPVIKALIYGAIAGIINYLWVLFGVTISGSVFWGAAVGPMVLIGSIIGAIIGLFIGGLILLIFSAICNGNTDYEANVRATASLMVLMPVGAVLSLFAVFSAALSTIIGLVVNAYGLWMLYNALVETLKAKASSAKVLVIVILAIAVLFTIIGLIATAFFRQVETSGWY